MKLPLVQYRVLVQYFEKSSHAAYPARASFVQYYPSYKAAKKECLKVIKGLQVANKTIERAAIEPQFLEEILQEG